MGTESLVKKFGLRGYEGGGEGKAWSAGVDVTDDVSQIMSKINQDILKK